MAQTGSEHTAASLPACQPPPGACRDLSLRDPPYSARPSHRTGLWRISGCYLQTRDCDLSLIRRGYWRAPHRCSRGRAGMCLVAAPFLGREQAEPRSFDVGCPPLPASHRARFCVFKQTTADLPESAVVATPVPTRPASLPCLEASGQPPTPRHSPGWWCRPVLLLHQP